MLTPFDPEETKAEMAGMAATKKRQVNFMVIIFDNLMVGRRMKLLCELENCVSFSLVGDAKDRQHGAVPRLSASIILASHRSRKNDVSHLIRLNQSECSKT